MLNAGGLDAETFWERFRGDRLALLASLLAKYPLMPPRYVADYLDCCQRLVGNRQILSYLDADLGAAERGFTLVDSLVGGGIPVAGARCLDIGCSNGGLLLAAQRRGASTCLGVDVSEDRLSSARMVCTGERVEFLRLDAALDPIPGSFDLIFCVDTLEHVSDWRRLILHAVRALAPGGRVFLSLHNARHPSSVLSEPHYGVPGLVLLPTREAAALWGRVRGGLGSEVDYDVAAWPGSRDVQSTALSAGYACIPWIDCSPPMTRHFGQGRTTISSPSCRWPSLRSSASASPARTPKCFAKRSLAIREMPSGTFGWRRPCRGAPPTAWIFT